MARSDADELIDPVECDDALGDLLALKQICAALAIAGYFVDNIAAIQIRFESRARVAAPIGGRRGRARF